MKRNSLALALFTILLLLILGCGSGGDPDLGTASNPFLVSNEADLRKVGTGTGGWDPDSHYRMTANITMTGGGWRPIDWFAGTFDGNGHTITGLTNASDWPGIYYGLFGRIDSEGVVKNLGLVNVNFNIANNMDIGGVAGGNSGTVQNCYVTGNISNSAGVWSYSIGGVVGDNGGTVQNCYFTGSISNSADFFSSSFDSVGGVAGSNSGTIQNCYSTASVSSDLSSGSVGGVAGGNGGTVENSYSTGSVQGTESVGGVVGRQDGNYAIVQNCYSTGSVQGTESVGGVVGNNDRESFKGEGGTVQNCVALTLSISRAGGSSGTEFGRVAGISDDGTLANNRARSDMVFINVTPFPPVSSDAADIHGADVAIGTSLSTVFSGWDTGIWNIPGVNLAINGALPTLRNAGGSQNPTLP